MEVVGGGVLGLNGVSVCGQGDKIDNGAASTGLNRGQEISERIEFFTGLQPGADVKVYNNARPYCRANNLHIPEAGYPADKKSWYNNPGNGNNE